MQLLIDTIPPIEMVLEIPRHVNSVFGDDEIET